jgi:hypothetical protein
VESPDDARRDGLQQPGDQQDDEDAPGAGERYARFVVEVGEIPEKVCQ